MEKWKLARIKNKDGYTFARHYAGKKYEVIDTLKTDEFFECNPVDSGEGYYPIRAFTHDEKKNEYGGTISTLYMHKSRIEFIDSLPDSTQEKVYFGILENYRQACIQYRNNTYTRAGEKRLGNFAYPYVKTLSFLHDFIIRTKDSALYKEFFIASSYDDGGISEISSGYIAQCLIDNEALFLRELKKMKKTIRERVVSNADFGLESIYGQHTKEDVKKLKYYENKLHVISP